MELNLKDEFFDTNQPCVCVTLFVVCSREPGLKQGFQFERDQNRYYQSRLDYINCHQQEKSNVNNNLLSWRILLAKQNHVFGHDGNVNNNLLSWRILLAKQNHVFGHDGHALGVDCAQLTILEKLDKVRFRCFTKFFDSWMLGITGHFWSPWRFLGRAWEKALGE